MNRLILDKFWKEISAYKSGKEIEMWTQNKWVTLQDPLFEMFHFPDSKFRIKEEYPSEIWIAPEDLIGGFSANWTKNRKDAWIRYKREETNL